MPSDPGAKFFVYGGLILPVPSLPQLHDRVQTIREAQGYTAGDSLKFATADRPSHVTIEQARDAKNLVVEACVELGATFIACVVLHKIAANITSAEMVRRGANNVIGRFNRFLFERSSHGICVVDRLPATGEYRYLTDKFCHGLDFEDGTHVALDRIKLFAASCDGASHANSAMDIVLGAFRYCINDPKNLDAAKKMMVNVARMIWHRRIGDDLHVGEMGLVLRPKNIKVARYQAEYDALIEDLNTLIADAEF